MQRVAAILCVLLLLPLAAASDEQADTRAHAARYYAAGLEAPLLELRRGVMLLEICATRMRGACTKEQRQLAASHQTHTLLDELTLFPQRPDTDTAAKNAAELRSRIAATGAALMRTAGDYDRLLIARYGAVLRVCPDESDTRQRESLDALTTLVLRQFQGLDGADFDLARRELADAETQAAETLRAMPATDCAAVLTLGQLLMEMMNAKLEPWTREDRRVGNANPWIDFDAAVKPPADDTPTRDLAISVAGNFVTLVATELQLTVFPETAPRIKAIAEAEGLPSDE